MKKLYPLLLLQIIVAGLNAQTINICTNFCTRDLSLPITGLTIDSIDVSYCKPSGSTCTLVNYFDVQYEENTCPQKPPAQWTNTDNKCFDDPSATPLVFRVYYPNNNSNYSTCKLPAVILFHAGSYAECSSYNNGGAKEMGRALAYRGFVVFNVNYRVGVIPDRRLVNMGSELNTQLKFVSAQQMLAIYRALQDARGAVRSIIKMQADGVNSDKYQINSNVIFLAGMSAGALLALHTEFYGSGTAGQGKIDAVFPGVSAVLGPIDQAGVYYANPPANIANDYFGKVKGILNCWGSLFVPATDVSNPYNFFAGQGYALPPVISFHGVKDTVFNYIQQGVYFSRSQAGQYGVINNTESRCLPSSYTTPAQTNPPLDPIPYEYSIGSQAIYNMLHTPPSPNAPITTEIYLDCNMYHGLDEDDPACGTCTNNADSFLKPGATVCIQCSYRSNFGTANNTAEKTYGYIAGRAATFFQTIIGSSTANINRFRFVDCENNRVTCTGSTTTGCSDTDECPN